MLLLLFVSAIAWPDEYEVEGTFSLPYANLVMPFSFVYSAGKGTALEWFEGKSISLQNVQLGMDYTIAVQKDHVGCSSYNASGPTRGTRYHLGEDEEVLTSMLPDMEDFTRWKSTDCPTSPNCAVYGYKETIFGKENTYTITVVEDDDGTPVTPLVFKFIGYDNLIGSHYDHYVVVYQNYTENAVDKDVFTPPDICKDATPSDPDKYTSMFNNVFRSPFDTEFRRFLSKHEKMYESLEEYERRIHHFADNRKYIAERNQLGLTYKLGMTIFGDHSHKEVQKMKGLNLKKGYNPTTAKNIWRTGDKPIITIHESLRKDVEKLRTADPRSLDWRFIGAVSPVKDQAVCGSCWAFGSTGAVESGVYLKTGKMTLFSEQYLVDCAWYNDTVGSNLGCDGGFAEGAYSYVKDNGGLPTETGYSRSYESINDYCVEPDSKPVKLTGYTVVEPGNEEALISAIRDNGPCYIAIDASHRDFSFYVSGVYYNPECMSDADDLDHAVMAIGFGSDHGTDYWWVKNSWSTYWGDEGFVKMARMDNNCGVATDAVFPIISKIDL